eukprot:1358524-Amorphochlora_amoeboformis.AAC.1
MLNSMGKAKGLMLPVGPQEGIYNFREVVSLTRRTGEEEKKEVRDSLGGLTMNLVRIAFRLGWLPGSRRKDERYNWVILLNPGSFLLNGVVDMTV